MKIVTVSQMVAIEQASDHAGHAYDAMMELAGRAVAAAVLRHMEPWDTVGGILVLAGPGNNGGDGLVAARYLHQWEPRRPVAIYCWKRDPKEDPNYEAVRRLKLPIVHAEEDAEFGQLGELLLETDVVVDALLGTGASRPIGGSLAGLLAAVHQGMARRQQEELEAETDEEPAEPATPQAAAGALQPVADFDFLRLPPYQALKLPQVIAVDCPSGLNCDTGELDPAALRADLTVTFANPKVGHFMADGPASCGRLEVADIGTDAGLAADVPVWLVTPAFAAHLLPERPPDAHKGTFGKALIVAGSVNYTGAAHLAGAAAYRVGAGLVTMGVIPSVHPIVAAGLVEATWLLLPEQLGVLSPEAARSLTEEAGAYAALLVGPGLTQEQEAVQFVHRLLGVGESRRAAVGFVPGKAAEPAANDPSLAPKLDDDGPPSDARPTTGFLARRRASAPAFDPDAVRRLPLVIDADALNALAQVDGWPQHLPPNAVLTPHPGEMARLCGCSTREVAADRFGMARSKAAEWNAVVLLKGAYSVVAAPDGRTAVLPFANPALATAGSGDVLAGAIVGLLAQGLPSFEGAVLGSYLHGLAGELARQDIGDAGVVAGDLLARLPEAIRRLRSA